jgi:hypothetical protein
MTLLNSIPRRQLLKTLSCGFGYTAFAGLAADAAQRERSPMAPRPGHFPARAKHVIFLFMRGGPSQMDTFDYKPELNKNNGKKVGKNKKSELFGSPWKFQQHGESGLWMSEILPQLAGCADDLCVIRSMQTDSSAHPLAMPQMHTGSFQFTRPSIGSWVLYGLGTENQDLPGFISINPSRVFGGPANFGSAFLPAAYQGARIGWEGQSLKNAKFRNVGTDAIPVQVQREQLDLLQRMNGAYDEASVEGVIDSFELGARMQDAAPQVMDLSDESEQTLKMYGINEKKTDNFGRQCLLARRFVESGVRFIELGHGSWDHHRNLEKGLAGNCQEIDQPFAALIKDLKQRGLLEDTLIVWGGEFGRLPELQYETGRGHNAEGFTFVLAGGGTRGGHAHGATDDLGNRAVDNPVHLHDLHATILHLLGLDHEKLTYRYGGRDFRLTDVHGHVVNEIIG